MTEGAGLYLEISLAGSKRWFQKIYRDDKETRLALGNYPAVGLSEAQRARDAAKLQKAEGQDVIQARKLSKPKATNPERDSFKVVALKWYEKARTSVERSPCSAGKAPV
ncbi:Arm DNA-binding domain-containing protein [Diaphorobacter sp.]|uniref:Arm DNA-binding domain-containing protein n=1 Tax=Diaphorobacter sp. TaxID=1934310 RepID=UPI003D1380D2